MNSIAFAPASSSTIVEFAALALPLPFAAFAAWISLRRETRELVAHPALFVPWVVGAIVPAILTLDPDGLWNGMLPVLLASMLLMFLAATVLRAWSIGSLLEFARGAPIDLGRDWKALGKYWWRTTLASLLVVLPPAAFAMIVLVASGGAVGFVDGPLEHGWTFGACVLAVVYVGWRIVTNAWVVVIADGPRISPEVLARSIWISLRVARRAWPAIAVQLLFFGAAWFSVGDPSQVVRASESSRAAPGPSVLDSNPSSPSVSESNDGRVDELRVPDAPKEGGRNFERAFAFIVGAADLLLTVAVSLRAAHELAVVPLSPSSSERESNDRAKLRASTNG